MQSIDEARIAARRLLAEPGDWLTGAERVAVWHEVRDAATNELDRRRADALSPYSVDGHHTGTDTLSAAEVEVIHRVASDPGRLTRTWADAVISELGEERYTELVGVTAIVTALDMFDRAMGRPVAELPEPRPGDPARTRPDGMGDTGAWVSQSLDKSRANVSRTLSLVPVTNGAWRTLVDSHYSRGAQFYDLAWQRALSRPQVELIAARTTVAQQCFY
jgi:hypothetical protein